MPYGRLTERGSSAVFREIAEADLPADVRAKVAKSKPLAKAAAPRPKPVAPKPTVKPKPPAVATSNGSARRSPAKPRPTVENGVKVSSRPTSTPSTDRIAARARADELLRARGVSEAVIGSIPPPTGNPHRDAADAALRRDGADERLIASVNR